MNARHAAQRPGYVTGAFAIAQRTDRGRPARFMLRTWPAVPVLALIPSALHGHLMRHADAVLGYDAILCLVACLMVTPFITVTGCRLGKLRVWYGLWMAGIALMAIIFHLAAADAGLIGAVAEDAVDWTGLVIAVPLIPLAVSSGMAAQKLLGREWKRWQRPLTWTAWALVALHLVALRAWVPAAAFTAATIPLILVRYGPVRRRIKAWRTARYEHGGMWAAMTISAYLLAGGVILLLAGEVAAVAGALR